MTKQKITISLDEEIAKQLRADSFEIYGNSRSFSKYIEDLATGVAGKKAQQETCRLGLMSEWAISRQSEFNKAVEDISQQLKALKMPEIEWPAGVSRMSGPEMYFVLKEVMEQRLNQLADSVNDCYTCNGLDDPLPTYPDAGHNFENLFLASNRHR